VQGNRGGRAVVASDERVCDVRGREMGEVGGVSDSPPVKENGEREEKKLDNSPPDFIASGLSAWAGLGLSNQLLHDAIHFWLSGPENSKKRDKIYPPKKAATQPAVVIEVWRPA
jgi:hypothetical protein